MLLLSWPVVLIGLGSLVGAIVPLIHRSTSGRVTALHWRRDIDVETEHWVRRSSSWGFPANSRNGTSRTVRYWTTETRWVTKYEYVFGKMQIRTVPDYRPVLRTRTEYSYEVPKRQHSHTASASGDGQDDVRWPTVTGGIAGRRRERYTATFTTRTGKRCTRRLPLRTWKTLAPQAEYPLRITWYGTVLTVGRPASTAPLSNGR